MSEIVKRPTNTPATRRSEVRDYERDVERLARQEHLDALADRAAAKRVARRAALGFAVQRYINKQIRIADQERQHDSRFVGEKVAIDMAEMQVTSTQKAREMLSEMYDGLLDM